MMGSGGAVMGGRGMGLVHRIKGARVALVPEGMVVMAGAAEGRLAQVGVRGGSISPRGEEKLAVEMIRKHPMELPWSWCMSLR